MPKTPIGPKKPAPPRSAKLPKRKEDRRSEFLVRANEAAKLAVRGKNYSARHAWVTIASMYRILAQTLDHPPPHGPKSPKLPDDPIARGVAIMGKATADKMAKRKKS